MLLEDYYNRTGIAFDMNEYADMEQDEISNTKPNPELQTNENDKDFLTPPRNENKDGKEKDDIDINYLYPYRINTNRYCCDQRNWTRRQMYCTEPRQIFCLFYQSEE